MLVPVVNFAVGAATPAGFATPPETLLAIVDGLIALSCYAVCACLAYFSARRAEMRFRWALVLFSAFLFCAGTTFALALASLWWPLESWSAVAGALTAVAGFATALALWRTIPAALGVPSPRQLARVVRDLECESATRQRTEETLRASEARYRELNATLERRIGERTVQLEDANRSLQAEIERRRKAQRELQQANEKLSDSLRRLERHTSQLDELGQMSDLLQTCATAEETTAVSARYAASLFPCSGGGVFLIQRPRGLAEAAVTWGTVPPREQVFPAEQCWAIRRGKLHPGPGVPEDLRCAHMDSAAHVCAPLIANGETLGVLQLRDCPGVPDAHERAVLATLAERTALALANLRLREDLLAQSIHDPLTGLYNRRYMEETLQIEERRSRRSGQPFGILMLDLDHFKELNDTRGHEAGDDILREFGRLLLSQTRAGDVACRYGGEEFTVILPGATHEASLQRARQLRDAVTSAKLARPGEDPGCLTVSIGVAAFPRDGRDWQAVLQRADQALYRAKERGRDRVEAV